MIGRNAGAQGRAHRFARDVESGMVWVNTYFDRDATAPGADLSGVGSLVGGGAANSQLTTHPRYIVKARARRYIVTHR